MQLQARAVVYLRTVGMINRFIGNPIFTSGSLRLERDTHIGTLAGRYYIMSQRKPDPIRYCEQCGKRMHRKRYGGQLESSTAFAQRRYCNRLCWAAASSTPVKPDTATLPESVDPGQRTDPSRKRKGKMSYREKKRLGLARAPGS